MLGAGAVCLGAPATAQPTLELTEEGWAQAGERDPERAQVDEARRLIVEGRHARARKILKRFLESEEGGTSPFRAEAVRLLGDTKLAMGEEWNALFDYEQVIREFPASEQFVLALERELDIGNAYLAGLNKRFWGMRIDPADSIGEELLIRVQERLPGSALAEQAALDLADYYYRNRKMKEAAEMYRIFLSNYPRSEHRKLAMERRIFSNIAQFKGPSYDATGLVEAKLLIEDYAARYPAEARRLGLTGALVSRLDASNARQMKVHADWYANRGDLASTRLILRRLARRYPDTLSGREALDELEERGWLPRRSDVGPLPDAGDNE